MHILIVPAWWPSPEQPIAGTFVVDYARAFAKHGARVGVIYPDLVSFRRVRWSKPPPLRALVQDECDGLIPVVRVRGLHTAAGSPRRHMKRYLARLKIGYEHYLIRYGRPDVIHAHCAIPAGWAALQLNGSLKDHVLITEHTGPFSLALTPAAAGLMTKSALAEARGVVAVSGALRAQMIAAGIEREIEVIPNCVAEAFHHVAPPYRNGDFRLVFVGRLAAEKGVGELLEAMKALNGVQLDIVGDGPMGDAMRRTLKSLGRSVAVTFHGLREKPKVAKIVAAAHALVLPSYSENCPLAIAEALCIGRPVLTTRGTGCEAMLLPGDGMLCEPRDAASLADGLRKLVSQYDGFDSAAIAARAAARFGAAAVAGRYFALFDRLVKP